MPHRPTLTRLLSTAALALAFVAVGATVDAATTTTAPPTRATIRLLDFAFDRYYETSGLFGDVPQCLAMVDRLKAIGVQEIACLIDFGLSTDTVLEHLPHLNIVREEANLRATPAAPASTPLTAEERRRLDALLAETPPGNTP